MFPLYFLYDVWAVLILRLALGAILIAHGWLKLRDLKATTKGFDTMGFKPGKLFGTIATFIEFFGGIALVLGLFVVYIAALVTLEFVVILFWRFAKRSPLVGGFELDLLILASCIVLFSLGGGAYSLDRLLFGWL